MRRTDCITGSLTLSQEYAMLLDRVMSALAGTGSAVAVTCAAGASAQALVRANGMGCLAAVFALGDATGAGFWAGCGPFCNLTTLARDRVHWMAGGPITQPLPIRLAERTKACLRYCAGSAPGARLLAFADRSDCPDALGAAQNAAGLGMGVIVFPCGFAADALPLLVPGGAWVPAGVGAWAEGVQWVPPRPMAPAREKEATGDAAPGDLRPPLAADEA